MAASAPAFSIPSGSVPTTRALKEAELSKDTQFALAVADALGTVRPRAALDPADGSLLLDDDDADRLSALVSEALSALRLPAARRAILYSIAMERVGIRLRAPLLSRPPASVMSVRPDAFVARGGFSGR